MKILKPGFCNKSESLKDINPKILLVDDNPTNIRVAAKILRQENYNISFAQSGRDALQKAGSIDFDAILLDIMMPGMDGYEVCEKLKSNPATRHIPVIFLTAKTETENVVRAFELGGADYVTKPFNSQELLARVGTQVRLKKSLESLEKINKDLSTANNTKDKMFSIISHDLLGPIGNIKESLEVIVNGEVKMDEQNMQSFLRSVWTSVNSSYSLLDNLLFWARSQQGRLTYRPKNINLTNLVSDTIHLLEGLTRQKSIELKTMLGAKVMVFADRNAIKTIMRNLMSNAIKFTNENGLITVDAKEWDNEFLLISLTDNGIGMDEKTKDNLFQKFKNEPRWGTDGERGVGLGLVITREFVEKHGGKIWVNSEEGKGSTFYFTLPREQ
jgi:signal transduction histidine kinase